MHVYIIMAHVRLRAPKKFPDGCSVSGYYRVFHVRASDADSAIGLVCADVLDGAVVLENCKIREHSEMEGRHESQPPVAVDPYPSVLTDVVGQAPPGILYRSGRSWYEREDTGRSSS